jgi:hypothetical protein
MSVKPRLYPHWLVTAEYSDNESHWQSQSRHRHIAYNLDIKNIDWDHGRTTPKDWFGYNKDNPSPGKSINQHFWRFYDKDEAMAFFLEGTDIQYMEKKQ